LASRLAHEGIHAEPARYAVDALLATGNVAHTHAAREGLFLIQDEASQLVAQLVIDLAPSCVLDACAAPGGKTVALRGGLPPGARLVAADLRPRRLRVLRATLARTGASGVRLVQADFVRGAPFRAAFDLVFVDAPCSGLGTLRRDPEIRWRRVEADLHRLAATQVQMLKQAAECVRAGGRIVYATCSSEPEENEQVVAQFLAQNERFTPLPRASHPWARTRLGELLDENGWLMTSPHEHGLEAFFAAVLQRD
jgi:16S rRNA (cytosine967-C5)-methyltransferase